jgi:hypothetical protein
VVRCNICHGLFNERYLASHKRLAHEQRAPGTARPISEKEAILEILRRFDGLSPKAKKKVVDMLTLRAEPHGE